MLTCPSAYAEGYEEARRFDGALADSYIRHTTVGDPELDPVTDELVSLPPPEMHRFVRAGVEQDDEDTPRRAGPPKSRARVNPSTRPKAPPGP